MSLIESRPDCSEIQSVHFAVLSREAQVVLAAPHLVAILVSKVAPSRNIVGQVSIVLGHSVHHQMRGLVRPLSCPISFVLIVTVEIEFVTPPVHTMIRNSPCHVFNRERMVVRMGRSPPNATEGSLALSSRGPRAILSIPSPETEIVQFLNGWCDGPVY